MGSMCALSHGSQEPVPTPMGSVRCTCRCHKGRADAKRVSKHPNTKPVETAHAGLIRISKRSNGPIRSSGLWPLRGPLPALELNRMGISHKPFKRQSNVFLWFNVPVNNYGHVETVS